MPLLRVAQILMTQTPQVNPLIGLHLTIITSNYIHILIILYKNIRRVENGPPRNPAKIETSENANQERHGAPGLHTAGNV